MSGAPLGLDNPGTADIRQLVAKGGMSTHQIVAIAICVGLNMLDGFDVLVMSFTAAGVSGEWKLTGSELGLLFSAGLVGMAAGSLFLAPRADRFGRRTIVMASVITVSLGMLFSGFARNSLQLGLLRAMTGVGIGGILASATVLVAEYSSSRWRSTSSFLYTSGYSLGATIGGAIAAVLISRFGWRTAFEFGAVASILMLPVSYWGLPESLDFLITRQPPGALLKLNRLLTKMHHATVGELPRRESDVALRRSSSVRRLLAPPLTRSTVLIWIAFFFMMGGYYFVFSWTPKLLTSSGLTAQQGINSGVLLSLGGIAGTVLFAFIARAIEVRRLTLFCLLASAVLMGLFAIAATNPPAALIAGVVLGGMSTTAMAGFYALTPTLYYADLRTSGMGWGIGIGRIGAILAPLATGVLVDHNWHSLQLFCLFAGTFLLAGLALAGMAPAVGRVLPVREFG
jgi:benzoate transport